MFVIEAREYATPSQLAARAAHRERRQRMFDARVHCNVERPVKKPRPRSKVSPLPTPERQPVHPKVVAIQEYVATSFGIPRYLLCSALRDYELSHPRQVAMAMAREILNFSYPVLGRYFEVNHTTILHAVKQVKKRADRDKEYAEKISGIRSALRVLLRAPHT